MRIAALDVDGTLLFEDRIAPETVAAVRDWRAAGHLAVAATGRSIAAFELAQRGGPVEVDYGILATGAVVVDAAGEVLHRRTLSRATVRAVLEEVRGMPEVVAYGSAVGRADGRFLSTRADGRGHALLREVRELGPDAADAEDFISMPVWIPDDAERRRVADWVETTFADAVVQVNEHFADILPVGSTKGDALGWLVTHLGVPREEVELLTFGDSWNDLSMHAVADRSFSFPWSPAPVRAATHEVVDSVAEALPRLI